MRLLPVCIVLVAGPGTPSLAHPEHEHAAAPRVTHAERYAPTAMPDRVVLTWEGDPRTSQAVTWRTSTAVHAGRAEIAPADHGPKFEGMARTVHAETEVFTTDLSEAHVHTARLTDLQPGTAYVYRVGDGANWSEWYQFRTEPAEHEPFSFVYFGDAQNNVRSMWSRVTREAFRDAPRAAFFLHAGDLVNRAASDGEWGEWFEAGSFINAMIPVIATPGNHEYTKIDEPDGTRSRRLTDHFAATFAFPNNGPSGLESSVYFIDYQNLRVISLNSNERQAEQVDWLEGVLSANDRTWTVVTFHHPIYSTGRRRDNAALRDLWKPVFDRHPVDLVLNGHDHTYGRSGIVGGSLSEDGSSVVMPMQNVPGGVTARSAAGTVYVVSVSGPKMYDANTSPGIDFVRRAEDTQLYQIVSIDRDQLHFEARTAVGALYDAFTLVKRDGMPNELIERRVELAPRRR